MSFSSKCPISPDESHLFVRGKCTYCGVKHPELIGKEGKVFQDPVLGRCEYSSFYLTNSLMGGYSAVCEHGRDDTDYASVEDVIGRAEKAGMMVSLAGGRWRDIGEKGFGQQVTASEARRMVNRLKRLDQQVSTALKAPSRWTILDESTGVRVPVNFDPKIKDVYGNVKEVGGKTYTWSYKRREWFIEAPVMYEDSRPQRVRRGNPNGNPNSWPFAFYVTGKSCFVFCYERRQPADEAYSAIAQSKPPHRVTVARGDLLTDVPYPHCVWVFFDPAHSDAVDNWLVDVQRPSAPDVYSGTERTREFLNYLQRGLIRGRSKAELEPEKTNVQVIQEQLKKWGWNLSLDEIRIVLRAKERVGTEGA